MKIVENTGSITETETVRAQQPAFVETQIRQEEQSQLEPLSTDKDVDSHSDNDASAIGHTPHQPRKRIWIWSTIIICIVLVVGAIAYVAATGLLTNEPTGVENQESSSDIEMNRDNAIEMAKSEADRLTLSRVMLIDQLERDGFSHDDAVYGADNCDVNWMEQAGKKARMWMEDETWHISSYENLVERLVSIAHFTHEEAVYGADQVKEEFFVQQSNSTTPAVNELVPTVTLGQKNALSKAQSYLNILPFSHSGLVEQLEYDGFTHDEAVYGADNCDANWMDQAATKAQSYLDLMAFSRDGLIEQLEYDGFTHDEAIYGAAAVGY